jgi:hypothetical protein
MNLLFDYNFRLGIKGKKSQLRVMSASFARFTKSLAKKNSLSSSSVFRSQLLPILFFHLHFALMLFFVVA